MEENTRVRRRSLGSEAKNDAAGSRGVSVDERATDSRPQVDEEDVWLQDQIARDEAQAELLQDDPDAYLAKFVDEQEARRLREKLLTSASRIERRGHLREFPIDPVSRHVNEDEESSEVASANDESEDVEVSSPCTNGMHGSARYNGFVETSMYSSAPSTPRLVDYDDALRTDVYLVRELEARYDDTKRALLEHFDMLCCWRPHERFGHSDAFERLHDLLDFAALSCESDE